MVAEFLIDDYDAALGRVYFGSRKTLEEVLIVTKDKISRAIVDTDANKWITPFEIFERVQKIWKTDHVSFYSSLHLECHHLLNVLGCAARQHGAESILLFDNDRRVNRLLPEIENIFEKIIILGDVPIPVKEEKLIQIPASEADLRHIDIKANIVLCSPLASTEMLAKLVHLVRTDGVFVSLSRFVGMNLAKLSEEKGISIISVDFADAYRGLISRISRIESAMSKDRHYGND